MNFRNRLYRLQIRSVKTQQTSHCIQQTLEREFTKQVQVIDTILQIMYMAFRNNISMQEVYLDLVKAQGKNVKIRGKDCKKVYELLSDNKTAEIMFGQVYENEEKQRKQRQQSTAQKQGNKSKETLLTTINKAFRNINTQDSQPSKKTIQSKLSSGKMQPQQQKSQNDLIKKQEKKQNFFVSYLHSVYRRLYSRLVEEIVKKVTYYIINKNRLYEMLLNSIAEVCRRLETILRRIKDLKDMKMILDVVKLIFEENLLIEKNIYQALVNEGHVVSIQEFFRINGKMMEETITLQQLYSPKPSAPSANGKQPDKQQQETEVKTNSRFYQHHKGTNDENNPTVNKNKNRRIGFIKNNLSQPEDEQFSQKQEKFQKQQKNILHIERMHKEIQFKYNSALEKISVLMINNEEKIQGEDSILIEESQHKEEMDFQVTGDDQDNKDIVKLQQLQQGPFERWKRENYKRRSTKKKTSEFQYFSSQFRKIINELDEKKGKVFIGSANRTLTTENDTEKIRQISQVGKITNQTVSLKNPLNVARLLGKKFKTTGSTQFTYINKDSHIRNIARQKTQINNLLKIYENNHKGNDHSVLQKKEKDLIKANLLKKLSLKKSLTSNEKNEVSSNDKAEINDRLMKEVEDEHDKMMESEEICDTGIHETDLHDFSEDLLKKAFSGTEKTNSVVINLSISNLVLGKKTSTNQTQRNHKTQQPTHFPNNSPNNSLNNSPNNSLSKPPSIESLKVSNLQKVYNEFTNPLNVKYGFYNDENYRSLKKSLQKCELNMLKLKKGILKRDNLIVVKENFIFGENNLQSLRVSRRITPQVQNNLSSVKPQRNTHPILKSIQDQFQTSQNNFYLTSCQFSQQRFQPLHSKDMDKCIQKCIQKNSLNLKEKDQSFDNTELCQNQSSIRENNQNHFVKIKSLRITPRNSCGKRNQVYSTQRRMKMK